MGYALRDAQFGGTRIGAKLEQHYREWTAQHDKEAR
jgi:hypothetical protein